MNKHLIPLILSSLALLAACQRSDSPQGPTVLPEPTPHDKPTPTWTGRQIAREDADLGALVPREPLGPLTGYQPLDLTPSKTFQGPALDAQRVAMRCTTWALRPFEAEGVADDWDEAHRREPDGFKRQARAQAMDATLREAHAGCAPWRRVAVLLERDAADVARYDFKKGTFEVRLPFNLKTVAWPKDEPQRADRAKDWTVVLAAMFRNAKGEVGSAHYRPADEAEARRIEAAVSAAAPQGGSAMLPMRVYGRLLAPVNEHRTQGVSVLADAVEVLDRDGRTPLFMMDRRVLGAHLALNRAEATSAGLVSASYR